MMVSFCMRHRGKPVTALIAVYFMIVAVEGARCDDGAAAPPGRHERISRVTGEVAAASETRENLRILCDEIGGRLSGTQSGRRAREFVERTFNRYGLGNVHQEPFDLTGWERGTCSCEAEAPSRRSLCVIALGNTPSTGPDGVEAEVVDVGHGHLSEIGALGPSVRGKAALAVAGRGPDGRWLHRAELMKNVHDAGAAALLYQTTRPGMMPMTGVCWLDEIAPIPAAGLSLEDGQWIRRRLSRGERVRIRLSMHNITGRASSANVVGEIPGRSPEFVVVAAHLDAWDNGQGAVDNGTGSVIVIEAARALAAIGARPEAGIRFVLFMGEESGLVGSNAYADAHGEEMPRCRALINCDMVGDPRGLRVMYHESADEFFEGLLSDLHGFDLDEGLSHRVSIYGDQLPFLLAGVPVITPRSVIEDEAWRYYHTSADTYDKVGFAQLDRAAAFVATLALELASTGRRVLLHLDGEGVDRMIEENDLGEAVEVWGDRPHDR